MIDRPGKVVEPSRMPRGLAVISDMKFWSREDLDKWITHILTGQIKASYVKKRFQFREIPGPAGRVPRIVRTYEEKPHPKSKLVYTPLELLYGKRVASEAQTQTKTSARADWGCLPLARTTHVYPAYDVQTFRALRKIHAEEEGMCALISAVAQMEKHGPIHVSQ